MGFMDIIDKANEITLNRFKIRMKIAYSFIVIDLLMLGVGYISIYGESLGGIINTKDAIFIFIVFALVSSILMCRGLTRSIMKPLNEFNMAANRIANGDLTCEVSISSNDELGQLAGYFSIMTSALRNMVGNVQDFAAKVASTAHELSASSEEMKASTDQISGNTQDIAGGASQQAAKINEVSEALKQMSGALQQVALGSRRASEVASNSSNTAQEIGRMSNEIVNRIINTRNIVSDSASIIKELDNNSEKIGEIVNVITDISDQTNLLALNAAIEAARAGEHGRGFAVVAEEVRKLAEESRNSANKIKELIIEIQQRTRQAVESMDAGTKTVGEGAATIGNTVSSINNIVDASRNTANMFNEIMEIAKVQAKSIVNITSSMEVISKIATDSVAATNEAAGATEEQAASMSILVDVAQELAELSNELEQEITKFKFTAEAKEK